MKKIELLFIMKKHLTLVPLEVLRFKPKMMNDVNMNANAQANANANAEVNAQANATKEFKQMIRCFCLDFMDENKCWKSEERVEMLADLYECILNSPQHKIALLDPELNAFFNTFSKKMVEFRENVVAQENDRFMSVCDEIDVLLENGRILKNHVGNAAAALEAERAEAAERFRRMAAVAERFVVAEAAHAAPAGAAPAGAAPAGAAPAAPADAAPAPAGADGYDMDDEDYPEFHISMLSYLDQINKFIINDVPVYAIDELVEMVQWLFSEELILKELLLEPAQHYLFIECYKVFIALDQHVIAKVHKEYKAIRTDLVDYLQRGQFIIDVYSAECDGDDLPNKRCDRCGEAFDYENDKYCYYYCHYCELAKIDAQFS